MRTMVPAPAGSRTRSRIRRKAPSRPIAMPVGNETVPTRSSWPADRPARARSWGPAYRRRTYVERAPAPAPIPAQRMRVCGPTHDRGRRSRTAGTGLLGKTPFRGLSLQGAKRSRTGALGFADSLGRIEKTHSCAKHARLQGKAVAGSSRESRRTPVFQGVTGAQLARTRPLARARVEHRPPQARGRWPSPRRVRPMASSPRLTYDLVLAMMVL